MMKTGKNVVIAAMITFCFTASLLMVIPIRSANVYDPWVDYNENGNIGLSELSILAKSYNTAGDPTKNVNVTNFPLDAQGNLKTTDNLPSGTFNTSCKITIQTTSVLGSGNTMGTFAQGIYVPSSLGASFYFVFEPQTQEFNVDHIVLQSISDSLSLGGGGQQAQIWLNNVNAGTLSLTIQNQATTSQLQITQTQSLQQGMNNLTIQPTSSILVQDLSLFVEYQYTR